MIAPDAHQPIPLSPRSKVVATLREWIAAGRFGHGQPLPAERVLAKQLHVARVTVRSALSELSREGLLDAPPGRKRRLAGLAEPSLMSQTVAVLSTKDASELGAGAPNGYDTFIHYHAARAIEQAGLNVLMLSPQRLLDGGLAHLLAQRPAGVLVTHDVGESSDGQRLAAACVGAGIPVVAYGYTSALAGCDLVTSDQEQGSYELTRWLLARGRTRILRVWRTASTHYWLEQRDAGYERAMREAGLAPLAAVHTEELGHDYSDQRSVQRMVRGIAGVLVEHLCGPAPIDAILSTTDPHALQTIAALRLFAKRPNHDVLVVGYDNTWANQRWLQHEPEPPLATVDKNDAQLAAGLASLMLERLAGRLPPSPQRRVVPGTFIEIPRPR